MSKKKENLPLFKLCCHFFVLSGLDGVSQPEQDLALDLHAQQGVDLVNRSLQQVVVEAEAFVDQPLTSGGHNHLQVLVQHLAVDDAQEQLRPVVGLLGRLVVGVVLGWWRFLKPLDDAFATPEALKQRDETIS